MNNGYYPSAPLLLVDEDWNSLIETEALLQSHGISHLLHCLDSRELLGLLGQQPVAAILLEINSLQQQANEQLLELLCREFPHLPVIVATRSEELDSAVRCIKIGAFDYVIKPADSERLVTVVKNALALRDLREENHALRNCVLSPELKNPGAFAAIVTQNDQLLTLFRYAESVARSTEPLMITGEMGVGKNLLAHIVHQISSRPGSFISVDIKELDDQAFAATVFGRTASGRAAGRTGTSYGGLIEHAAGGTLFLDEINTLSAHAQTLLLRMLQTGNYLPDGTDLPRLNEARIVSATRCDLWENVRGGEFRHDLNFRLRSHHLHIPPLRERRDDIPLLVTHFLEQAVVRYDLEPLAVPDELWPLLDGYDFPANVRELEQLLYQAARASDGGRLALSSIRNHIGKPLINNSKTEVLRGRRLQFTTELPTMKEAAEQLLKEALARANGNQSVAGRMLGISQQAVSKRLKSLAQ